ncbi:hyaluronidase Tab y 2.0101-like [Bradysia coprophila]|uniref:hyaluronidase Tab y 2.0101-like n=1 Tax=Bradysia coprophila TaxID=38358 RepID=UPI00187D7314|nr:hyaluronidase Tab y 2.0101-like [Bradysia coprophila]
MFVKYLSIVASCELVLLVTWAKAFTTYWNIPSFACSQRFNLPVLNVAERYGIVQNFNDNFRGEQISILYDPGLFPAIYPNGTYRNGGVPQEGDLKLHLEKFELDVDKYIPDKENSGLAIIDFELWRPVYRQNFGKLLPYKELSTTLVAEAMGNLTDEAYSMARDFFTDSAKMFMLETIEFAKQLRPNAKWGYYGLPHCFNGRRNVTEDCEQHIQEENDATQWLYDHSDIILPSIYMPERIIPCNRPLMVKGRIRESLRLSNNVNRTTKPLVIAYHRYKFPDSLQYLNQSDHIDTIKAAKEVGADGIILWGAWKDVNNIDKCMEFYDYLEDNLGPSFQSTSINGSVVKPSGEKGTEPPTASSAAVQFTGKIYLLKLFIVMLIVSVHKR